MTTSAAAPVPAPTPAAPAAAPRGVPTLATPGGPVAVGGPSARTGWRARLGRTPGRLVLAGVGAVVACLVAGGVGLAAGISQSQALSDAAADAGQLVGVQEVRNDLVAADATLTNAFLVGGLEPAQMRVQYDESVDAAAQGLAQRAGGNARDAHALGTVTSDLTVYTGLVEQARANNRQGFPVGAAYLDQASTELREQMLPVLDDVVDANAGRVSSSFGAVDRAAWLVLVVLVAVGALVWVQVWLARRTHRRLNRGLVTATVLVLVSLAASAVVLGGAASAAHATRDVPYQDTLDVSQAYALVNDARSMESFTLIKRGSGAAYEEQYQANVAQARTHLEQVRGATDGAALLDALEAWTTEHEAIRAADDGGDWDGAVALATATGPGTSSDAFAQFSGLARSRITADADQVADELSGSGRSSVLVGWLALAVGVVAAAFAWRGLSVRLREYR